jgi:hypothetical protein
VAWRSPRYLTGVLRLLAVSLERHLAKVPYVSVKPVGTLVGTLDSPLGDQALILKVGHSTASSDVNGRVFITFTEAFPNGIVSAVALRDGTATAVSQISIENDQIDKTKLCFVVANSAGTVQTSTAVAFSWLAVGF